MFKEHGYLSRGVVREASEMWKIFMSIRSY